MLAGVLLSAAACTTARQETAPGAVQGGETAHGAHAVAGRPVLYDSPGTHSYHAVEASREPGHGEAAADRLARQMPGAGHLVHMPSHIYWRVGRYRDAVSVNQAAVRADREYFLTGQPSPIYRGLYYPHNIDFIWHAASMQGRGGFRKAWAGADVTLVASRF